MGHSTSLLEDQLECLMIICKESSCELLEFVFKITYVCMVVFKPMY